MPYIDYFLSTDVVLTKSKLSESLAQCFPNHQLNLGRDNRTWNKKQLQALSLLLCNVVFHGDPKKGIFLYSRNKQRVPHQYNPSDISYSSIFFVIDSLIESKILVGKKAKPRTKGKNPKKLSEFKVTKQSLKLAKALGIVKESITSKTRTHVRLRERRNKEKTLGYEENVYTRHTESLMRDYCGFLNTQSILLSTKDYSEGDLDFYGLLGEKIHLHRNYSTLDLNDSQRVKKLWTQGCDPEFLLGGRSGTLWHGARKEDRIFILINRQESRKVDFPCSHINLCYKQEVNQWYQTKTYKELVERGREKEDAYIVSSLLPRDLVKKMVELMLSVRTRSGISKVFNKWLRQENSDKGRNASNKLVRDYYQAGYTNIEIMDLIERKHHRIKSYFYKGKLAGQILQWEEANLIHHIAHTFQEKFGFPVLTVYDELIFEEEHLPLVKRLMFTLGDCEVCSKYSLMSQIKGL